MNIGNISVTKLNEYIKYKLEGDLVLKGISVEGEISNCKTYASGHMYFTLKDKNSAIRCVMFKGYRQTLEIIPKDGDAVIVKGDVSVYTRDGNYQLYATGIKKEGDGELYEKYLELKNKLEKEGLFKEEYKKPLKKYPLKLGVITSDSGAVLHDIKNVITRRFPFCSIILFASRVQGEGADDELISAIEQMDKAGCDTAIIGRGGGSIEDLWQFNSEKLARAIFLAKTPIISAVGHETDFTICDFVSDMRAPTPSAAAEIAVPDSAELRLYLSKTQENMLTNIMGRIADYRSMLKYDAGDIRRSLSEYAHKERICLNNNSLLLKESIKRRVLDLRTNLNLKSKMISLNGPIMLMNKGYALIFSEEGRVKNASQLKVDDDVTIKFSDGELRAKITGENYDKQL